ncbi:MAG: phospholipid carrier-dependent glycosyltransferase [Bradymonadales bacterium]|nr:phospholipid carrier-dependent glycosyltransferase [Bradymonadales bacterium]
MIAPDEYRRRRLRLADYLIALFLFAGYLALLMSTNQIGFPRDEGYYFHAAKDYYGWFAELERNIEAGQIEDSFTQESIDRHWGYNPEHPVLMKTLFGLSGHYLSERHQFLSPSTAMRLPAQALSALLMALVFLFVVEAFATRAGALLAVAAIGFQPHFFFHGHLACFDAPMVALRFLVVYAYWKSLHSRLWVWLTGIFWGLALITKLNAFFIPLILLLHWIWAGRREFGRIGRGLGTRIKIPRIPRAFVSMAVFGPIIFYLGWPRHWFDTFNRIIWYFNRHLGHEHYFVYYFGEALVRPPFPITYPLVMTLVTVPVGILLAAALGGIPLGGDWLRGKKGGSAGEPLFDPRGTGFLVALNLVFPIALIASPGTPVFGGTKHWMEAMPYLAVSSGLGGIWAFERLSHRLRWGDRKVIRSLALALYLVVLITPMVHATLYIHPFGSSYYNELIGGVRGGADLDMLGQFWGDNTRIGLAYLDEIAPPNTRVFPHDANYDDMHYYREEGLLRRDIRDEWDPGRADFAFFNHQKAFTPVAQDIWRAMGTVAPMRVFTSWGVPQLSLYGSPQMRSSIRLPWE